VIAVLVGWMADSLLQSTASTYVYVGAGSGIGLLLADASLLLWGFQIRHRLPKVEKKLDGTSELVRAANPLPPLIAARTAAIAMAASRTGAALVGFYAGLILYTQPRMHVERALQHVLLSAFALLSALIMVVIGMWIERRCSPPTPPTTESGTTPA
jgi:high-affinity Fe2+/Pb2+ permease